MKVICLEVEREWLVNWACEGSSQGLSFFKHWCFGIMVGHEVVIMNLSVYDMVECSGVGIL